MPVRHFLRRDYLHILVYIIFLVFVSLAHQSEFLKILFRFLNLSIRIFENTFSFRPQLHHLRQEGQSGLESP